MSNWHMLNNTLENISTDIFSNVVFPLG